MVNPVSEFSLEEENDLLQYIVKNNKYDCLLRDQFWKDIEKENITTKTWKKLKEHFENKIVRKLCHPYFRLSKVDIENILRGSARSSQNAIQRPAKSLEAEVVTSASGNIGVKKIIVISRNKSTQNVYPNYRCEGSKRILVSRLEPSPDMTYPEPNVTDPKKTIVASLSTAKKKEIFVVRPRDEDEPFDRYGTVYSQESRKKPPKKFICFTHNVP